MNTVKRLRSLSLRLLPKRQFLSKAGLYFPAVIFASWLGTYLDLYFVGIKLYEFPLRPFPNVFPINIMFTIFALPLLTWVFLFLMNKINKWKRGLFTLLISLAIPVIEKASERWGAFRHSDEWSHSYSFFGYLLFFVIVWRIFRITKICALKKEAKPKS